MNALAAERSQLEHRVTQRTAQLAAANDTLREEIERRNLSERNFRGLIDAAPDAIVVIDSAGRITTVNEEAERMFGHSRGAMIGRDVEMIIPERFRAAHHAKRERYGESPSTRTIARDLHRNELMAASFPSTSVSVRWRRTERGRSSASCAT